MWFRRNMILVGGIPTPLKNNGVSNSWGYYSQYIWKFIKFHGSSHHQPAIKPGRDLSTGMSFFHQDGCWHFPWRQTSEAVDFYDGFIKKNNPQ